MTPREFIIWLRGFVQAANNFSATPKQWDDLKDQLSKVEIDDKLQEIRKYVIEKNSSWSVNNSPITDQTATHGRPQDSITYTVEPTN